MNTEMLKLLKTELRLFGFVKMTCENYEKFIEYHVISIER